MLQRTSEVCGIDEAGRGSLAGPVCAASVCLFDDFPVDTLRDSKKLTTKQRQKLFPLIISNSYWGVGWASVGEINRYNILQASLIAMGRAYSHMETYVNVNLALIDGQHSPCISISTRTIIRGDSLEFSIMAASILAKYSRDQYMGCLDRFYPSYNFVKHKGYPTKEHCRIISLYGLSIVHRKNFGICKTESIRNNRKFSKMYEY